MKRILITTLLSLCFALTATSQTVDCKKFKTGSFYYPNNSGKLSVRKESTQESYNNGKLEMLWDVKWLSDCKYEMTCTKILVDPFPLKVGDRIVTTITKTDGDCFTTSSVLYSTAFPDGSSPAVGDMCIKKE